MSIIRNEKSSKDVLTGSRPKLFTSISENCRPEIFITVSSSAVSPPSRGSARHFPHTSLKLPHLHLPSRWPGPLPIRPRPLLTPLITQSSAVLNSQNTPVLSDGFVQGGMNITQQSSRKQQPEFTKVTSDLSESSADGEMEQFTVRESSSPEPVSVMTSGRRSHGHKRERMLNCGSMACFPGVQCVGEETLRCGRCPSGYTGDGKKCRGTTYPQVY